MSNPNAGKVKWGVVWGKPINTETDPHWSGRRITAGMMTEIWFGQHSSDAGVVSGEPRLFYTKKEAEAYHRYGYRSDHPEAEHYDRYVKKFNPHKGLNQ
jgi:hypothetical protein